LAENVNLVRVFSQNLSRSLELDAGSPVRVMQALSGGDLTRALTRLPKCHPIDGPLIGFLTPIYAPLER